MRLLWIPLVLLGRLHSDFCNWSFMNFAFFFFIEVLTGANININGFFFRWMCDDCLRYQEEACINTLMYEWFDIMQFIVLILWFYLFRFAISENAYRSLTEENRGQCILISGKYYLNYFFACYYIFKDSTNDPKFILYKNSGLSTMIICWAFCPILRTFLRRCMYLWTGSPEQKSI